ncbi:MAG: ParB/RepB/Spo0J family partition protein [Anaerostipes sp.]|nr:ParB/RepB/Spo0J family partition protein [Anaerostipes sp.]
MAAQKKGLGRGMGALIPTTPIKEKQDTKNKEEETLININKVEPNPDQPRKDFDEEALKELSQSIQQYGVIQPLIVKKRKDYYEIVAGERRWRAAKLAGLKKVPVIVKDYSENEIVEIALIENIQRENLNAIEEALAYKRLMEEFSLKQEEVAKKVAKSRTSVTNSLRLLKLDERVQDMLSKEELSMGHARALLAIEDGNQQVDVANKVIDEKLSVRDIETLVKKLGKEPKEKKESKEDPNQFLYRDMEEILKHVFGSKVNIKNKSNKGKIEIEYYSLEELERIVDMMKSI